MKRKLFFAMFALVCFVWQAAANNINVTNATLTGQVNGSHTMVRFDLSWENSWRTNVGPANFDAAWVFVKYKVSGGTWNHATLSTTAGHHSIGTQNVPMTIRPGDTPSADGKGVFIYRTGNGTGNISLQNVLLRWTYPSNGVADGANVQIKVYAVEMVYVPQGPFFIGDGNLSLVPSSYGWKRNNTGDNLPYLITSESAFSVCSSTYTGSNQVYDYHYSSGYTVPSGFPKGYNAFFLMKYEVSQRQYMDFFNTLPNNATPRGNRNLAGSTSYRYMLSWSGQINDDMVLVSGASGDRACNYMNYNDACAYADWACLRPMTELEYEKASRGCDNTNPGSPNPIFPVNLEYAWGNTSYYYIGSTPTSDNTANERWTTCYNYNLHGSTSYANGPLRCGIFAAKGCTSNQRQQSGASYYGVMELSGNLQEIVITACHYYSPSYTCLFGHANGDGILTSNGNASSANYWGQRSSYQYEVGTSYTYAYSNGRKGGSFSNGYLSCRTSDRSYITQRAESRYNYIGFRAARSAPTGL